MKDIKETGVTSYIIPADYDGVNKTILNDFINLSTAFVNNITVLYDWANDLCMVEDSVTLDGHETTPLPETIRNILLTDNDVIEWMHRGDRLYP